MNARPNFRRWTPPKAQAEKATEFTTVYDEPDEPLYPLYAPRASGRQQAFTALEAAEILGLFEHEVRTLIEKKWLHAMTFTFTDCVVIARCEVIHFAATYGIQTRLRGVA